MRQLYKKAIAAALCALMLALTAGCGENLRTADAFSSKTDGVWGKATATPAASATPAAGEPGTWTVMLYLNGSDLESAGGEGTASLADIVNAQLSEDINVLIYTGGTSYWHNDTVSPNANQIWRVENNDLTLLETLETASMGDSGTLSGFISYAQTYYPADHKALLMWDHGGGSVIGFGADELYNYDGLFLYELGAALAAAYDGQPFELIGFDACLMASVETAAVTAPYARYMVASEEVEPGSGWDYEHLLEALSANTGMTGAELGTAITDGYFARSTDSGMEGELTGSVIDLSRIGRVEQLLAAYVSSLNGQLAQPATVRKLSTARMRADGYGDEPGAGGTQTLNMIDFYHFIQLQEDAAAAELMSAITECVVYERSGAQQPNSCGLSIYFPSAVPQSGDASLDIYSAIDFCPEYQAFMTDYLVALNDSAQSMGVDYDSELIPASQSGDLSEVGSFYVPLNAAQMEYLEYVYCTLGMYLRDGTIVDLGFDSDLTIDYGDNTVHDNFQGYWTGINGQFAAVYVMEETEDYVIYSIPVLYKAKDDASDWSDGDMAIVRATWYWDSAYENSGYYEYNGMYYMNQSYDAPSAKLAIEPAAGDVIVPIYWPFYAADGDYESYYTADPFTLGAEGIVLGWIELPSGSYQYGFLFYDVYGGEHYSEMTNFDV